METSRLGYNKAKDKAKQIYSKIGRIKCPPLGNEYVAFSRLGFNHIIRKGRVPRTKNEQKKRFALLPYVEKIIKSPKAFIVYRKETVKEMVNRHGEKHLRESTAHFWTFIERVESRMIKIVVRQLNNGQKHFFNIMTHDVHTPRKTPYKKSEIKKSPR